MEERQSRLSSMAWKKLNPYFCVRLIHQNSMFSNFCHVVNCDLYFDGYAPYVDNKNAIIVNQIDAYGLFCCIED